MRYNRTHSDYEFIFFRSRILQVPLKEEYHELHDQLRRQMLASLFFPFVPESKNLLSLLDEFPEIPRILFGNQNRENEGPRVCLSPDQSVRLAMQHFKCEKICRVAAIAHGETPQLAHFLKEVENAGLQTRREWLVPVARRSGLRGGKFYKTSAFASTGSPPTGFYITDDHLLSRVQRAVIASGVRVPQELKLVCHTNFPE